MSRMSRAPVSNVFECDPNLRLLDFLLPKLQRACVSMKKLLIVWMIFGSKLLSFFQYQQIYSSQDPMLTDRQAVVMLEMYILG